MHNKCIKNVNYRVKSGEYRVFFVTLPAKYYIFTKMKAEKILFITQEIAPYVPDSELTHLGRDIPMAAIDDNRETRVFMPKWGNINERRNQLHPVQRISGMNIVVDDTDFQLIIKVATIMGTRMQVYFIDDDEFFGKRLEEIDREGKEYDDNFMRAMFYGRSVLETVKRLRWTPDVVYCQGWTSAFVPLFLKTAYAEEPCFRDCRVIYTATPNRLTKESTVEEIGRQMEFRNANIESLEGFENPFTPESLDKLAIRYSDAVTFAKPNDKLAAYAKELNCPIMDGEEPAQYLELADKIWEANQKPQPEE